METKSPINALPIIEQHFLTGKIIDGKLKRKFPEITPTMLKVLIGIKLLGIISTRGLFFFMQRNSKKIQYSDLCYYINELNRLGCITKHALKYGKKGYNLSATVLGICYLGLLDLEVSKQLKKPFADKS